MDKRFPEDLQLIFLGQSIGVKNDGVMESLLRKIKFIEDGWGHRPILVTAIYDANLGYIEPWFSTDTKKEGQTRLNPDTRIFSVFDYFLNSYPYNRNLEVLTHPMRGDETLEYKEVSKNIFDVYKNETLLRREFFSDDGNKLIQIDLLDSDTKRTKSLCYDALGYMTKAVIWDVEKKDYHPAELYYTTDRKLRIRAEYNYIENPEKSGVFSTRVLATPNELVRYTLFDDNGNEIASVPTHEHLMALCIDGLTGDSKMKYIVCDECHLYGSSGVMYQKSNVANAAVIHNVFLNDAYNLKSEPQSYYKHVCENRRKFDAIIHLTDECKNDFETKYGVSRRNYVITHPYPFSIERVDFDKRDHKKALIAARFFPQKRLHLAIEIFSLVLKEIPEAMLDIYGFGIEEQALRDLIEKLEIGENVKIKGYTDKVTSLMRESACFIMTSFAEGLGLTLLECISNGCPAFAYDIKYGPAHIIDNNITGFVFKNDDKKSFAKQLIKYFNNIDMQKRMSDNCYDAAKRFSVETFLANYWVMTKALYTKIGGKDI